MRAQGSGNRCVTASSLRVRVRRRAAIVVAVASAAFVGLSGPAAIADPSGFPQTRILAGVGSQTTQDVMNALSNIPPSGSRVISSYDSIPGVALPPTKTAIVGSDCLIGRAIGSGDGVESLRRERELAAAVGRRPCIDFARSSVNQSQDAANAGFGLTWIPFAEDAVSYVTRRDSGLPTNLTTAQLAAIYTCTTPGTTSNPPTILPLLPADSRYGTRAFFLASIGVATPGGCVSTVDPTFMTQQLAVNNGGKLTDPRMLVPYSLAQFTAQYYKSVSDVRGSTEMRRIGGKRPGTATFPLRREVFNVLPTSELSDPAVLSLFVGANDPTDICNQQDLITQFGFTASPPGRCGQIDPFLQSLTGGPSSGNLPGPVS